METKTNEAKFTPGKWESKEKWYKFNPAKSHMDCGSKVMNGTSLIACAFGESSEEAMANARLIAAAPELLEALKLLQVKIFMLDGSENKEYQLASELIAKAEGKL